MDFITGLLILLVVALLFLIAMVVFTFVALGAVKAYRSRNSLKQIDVSDGIDESELQLIREALLKKKQIDAQAEAKAKLVAASAKIAEVAKS